MITCYEMKKSDEFLADIDTALKRVREADMAARMNDLELYFRLAVFSLRLRDVHSGA